MDTFIPICNQKNIQISCQIEPYIPFTGDENRIKQLIIILLDNAFQYTDSGGSISIHIHKKEKSLEMIICDTGIGISGKELEKIFDRFYRVINTRNRNPDGSGLGLSIAKWIVEQHNGKIYAASSLGKGTRFIITFPYQNR